MSAFLGSSAINKSGKKFAPKIARRRPAVTAGSEAASTTSSAEQTPSSTPAPSATAANVPESHNVLPTPPSTQALSQAPSTQPPVIDQSVSPAARSVSIEVPVVTTHTDDFEAGGRSPKRRRVEPSEVAAGPLGPPTTSDNAPSPVVIAIPHERTATVDVTSASAGPSQEPASNAQDNSTASESISRTREQIGTSEPVNQDFAEAAAAGNVPKSKRVTQPKAVKRRGPARVSNQDLIRDVMGPNAGVTKTPNATTTQVSSTQGTAQQSTNNDNSSNEGNAIIPTEVSTETPAESQTDAAVGTVEDAPGPAKAPKRTPNVAAARKRRQQTAPPTSTHDIISNQQVATQLEASAAANRQDSQDITEPAPAPATKRSRQPRQRKRTVTESQNTAERSGGDAQVPKPKRPRKKQPKTPTAVTSGDGDAAAGSADGEVADATSGDQDATGRKRPRNVSSHLIFDDEDRANPEKTRINATSMPMSVLTKDIPFVGTISQREEALSKIDWDEEKRKRMEERERIAMGEEVAQTQAERDAALARLQEAANASSTAVQAPRMRVVNGNLVLDTSSTQVDRNARAREDAEELQEVEEDELTTRVNQMSWIKANRKDPRERTTWGPTRADRWSDEQTEMFYEALKMFGTDFFIISKMFPGKTRANVKRKFVKEERLDPERIKRVLVGESVPMDFEEYKRKTGKDDDFFKDPEQLRKELEQETEQQKQEVEEAQARYAEQQRQRKLAKQGGADVDGEEGEGGTGKKSNKKGEGKKGKKGKVPIGGEEIEVVEFDGDELEHRR